MIDEKLLIEEIEKKIKQQRLEIIPNHDHYESEYMCIFNIFENIKKIIESQLKVGKWIPCSGCKDCKYTECEHYGEI